MTQAERAVALILRILGGAALCAIPAIFLPYSWMNTIHAFLGLGQLPDAPIVSYLARSLSMFYAMFGAVVLYASLSVRHNRSLVTLLAVLSLLIGITLLGIDYYSGMPPHWTLVEGPFTVVVGFAILWLQRVSK